MTPKTRAWLSVLIWSLSKFTQISFPLSSSTLPTTTHSADNNIVTPEFLRCGYMPLSVV